MKRFRFHLLLISLLIIGLSGVADAHSYLGSTVPADGEIVEEPVDEILLHFDAGIESATTIKVVDEEGNEVALAEEKVDSPTYTATLAEPLYSGTYVVEWTALGADGHATEGRFTFTVQAEKEAETLPEEDGKNRENEGQGEEPAVEEEQVQEELSDQSEEEGGSSLFWLVVIGVVILAVILYFLLRK